MFRKISLIGSFCAGVVFLLGSNAMAAWPTMSGGLLAWSNCISMESFWKKIGNPDQKDVYIQYTVTLKEIQYSCMNNGGGVGGEGTVFDFGLPITVDDQITNADLDGHGQALSDAQVTDDQIWAALQNSDQFSTEDACINPNWQIITPDIDPDATIQVVKFTADLTGFVQDNKTGEYVQTGTWSFSCSLDPDNPVYDAEGHILYSCDQLQN